MKCFYNRQGLAGLCLVLLLAGCSSTKLSRQAVEASLEDRTGHEVTWHADSVDASSLQAQLQNLLADTLSLETAVQITLLNNRHLQGLYASIGMAQADLVQAGRFENPKLDTHIGYPLEEDHAPDLGFSVAINFLDFFHIPLRKAVAQSKLEEVQLNVAKEVSSLVFEVEQAFYVHQAAKQQHELLQQVTATSSAAYETASLLREAGNIRSLDLNNERAFYEQTRLDAAYAELQVMQSREQLNRLMGLWGETAAQWQIGGRLPELQDMPDNLEEAEQIAIAFNFELAIKAQELATFAQQRKVVNATALLPHLKLGLDAEREGAWELGPGIGFPIPIFDQGQAQKAAIEAMIKEKQAVYYGMAVDIRATTRSMRQQMITNHQIAQHYRNEIVPLSSRISVETQEQYNAMQIGVFRLLAARQQEIQAGRQYIDALRDYWLAHSAYDALQQGVLLQSSASLMTATPIGTKTSPSTDKH